METKGTSKTFAIKEVELPAATQKPEVEEGTGPKAETTELPSTGIPRLDKFLFGEFTHRDIVKICDVDRTMLYVCLRLCELNTELADKLRAGLAKIVEPFLQGEYPKDFDEQADIAPIETWLSLLDGYEAGIKERQGIQPATMPKKPLLNPEASMENLLRFVDVIADDAAAACLACLDLQQANNQLAGEIRAKLWERVKPIIEEGQIPSDMDHDVAADMMRLLGIRDAVLALSN